MLPASYGLATVTYAHLAVEARKQGANATLQVCVLPLSPPQVAWTPTPFLNIHPVLTARAGCSQL